MTKLIVTFTILRKHLTISTTHHLCRFCIAAISLCVLQTAAGSLQSPDCDTEWIIGVNVVTGGVLCVLQTAVGSLQSPDSDTEWIIGVNVVTGGFCVCCRLQLVLYSHRTVILSG